ncbi:MAG TPA: crosslink repair DNA glycosylase YcaQ family protein [Longimicrobiales bacterium]|nr:crosslink repair DNA glycosylase YcaQ family protein [Longimicrobiales bacterium]
MASPIPVPVDRARAHVLAKQGLTAARLADPLEAVEATAGVYATSPTCYLSCAARVEGFRLAGLDRELYERRRLVRLRCVRGMAYVQPVELAPVLFACTGEPRDRTLQRIAKFAGLGERELLDLADRVEAVLAGRPPATVPEIRELLGGRVLGAPSALQYTVALLARFGRLVRAEPRGTWRSDLYAYARWEEWVGDVVPDMDTGEARTILALRYLRAFGPATVDDLKCWTGWTKRGAVAALAALGDRIVSVSIDGAEAWLPAEELDTLRPLDPEQARGVRLLPVWDAYFMGYAPGGRARQVAAADYGRVYDRAGNGTSALVVDGMAAGVWELDEGAGVVRVAPFSELGGRWEEVEREVAGLAAMLDVELRLKRVPAPPALQDLPRNAFLAPISAAARTNREG